MKVRKNRGIAELETSSSDVSYNKVVGQICPTTNPPLSEKIDDDSLIIDFLRELPGLSGRDQEQCISAISTMSDITGVNPVDIAIEDGSDAVLNGAKTLLSFREEKREEKKEELREEISSLRIDQGHVTLEYEGGPVLIGRCRTKNLFFYVIDEQGCLALDHASIDVVCSYINTYYI